MLFSSGKNTPMVSVKPLDQLTRTDLSSQYAVIMKGRQNDTRWGGLCCDFRDAMLTFSRPMPDKHCCCVGGKTKDSAGGTDSQGMALLFGNDLLQCAAGEVDMGEYTFFDYYPKEALHLSAREKRIIEGCMLSIRDEYEWEPDKYSCRLVVKKIGILLTLCRRFYDRQIMTRSSACHCIMKKIESTTDRFVTGQCGCAPTADATTSIAAQMQMSPAYLTDYVRFETGFPVDEYAQQRRFEAARRMLISSSEPVASIARRLGFSSTAAFSSVFKRIYGHTPSEARALC